jgi:hypothetical protein
MLTVDPLLQQIAEVRLGKYGPMCVRAWLSKHPEGAIRDAIEAMHQARMRGIRIYDPAAWISKKLSSRLQTMSALRQMRDTAAHAARPQNLVQVSS